MQSMFQCLFGPCAQARGSTSVCTLKIWACDIVSSGFTKNIGSQGSFLSFYYLIDPLLKIEVVLYW